MPAPIYAHGDALQRQAYRRPGLLQLKAQALYERPPQQHGPRRLLRRGLYEFPGVLLQIGRHEFADLAVVYRGCQLVAEPRPPRAEVQPHRDEELLPQPRFLGEDAVVRKDLQPVYPYLVKPLHRASPPCVSPAPSALRGDFPLHRAPARRQRPVGRLSPSWRGCPPAAPPRAGPGSAL